MVGVVDDEVDNPRSMCACDGGLHSAPAVHMVERGDGFAVTANPGMIASACRAVELGAARPADGNQELAAYGYKRGLCGPDSYAAALYGGYPAQR